MNLSRYWQQAGGYGETIRLAFPLILSTSAWSLQHFIDRMFLAWYSPAAIAASMPAGFLEFTIASLFIGTTSYISTFVAQYYGANQYEQIGKIIWQGLFFSLFAMVIILAWLPFAGLLFRLAGHAPEIQRLEQQYFVVLIAGGGFPIAAAALSSFFSGRGDVWTVMWVNVIATVVNIGLDYLLIFGKYGLPELGMRGAAVATVMSAVVSFALFMGLMLRAKFRRQYHTWSGRKFDAHMFRRLLYFGLPGGAHSFLDCLGFALFILLVGRYGAEALAATNIAFNINTLAFMPMFGFGIAVSVIVGQRLGENNPTLAERSTWSAAHLTFLYMLILSVLYVVVPGLFLHPFGKQATVVSFQPIYNYGVILLRFVALYSLFDAMNIVFSAAIKGAGDTRFVMFISVTLSWIVMVIPTFLATIIFHWSLFVSWSFATAYVVLLGLIFLVRFLQGKWKSMRVIEESSHVISVLLPEKPTPEMEI